MSSVQVVMVNLFHISIAHQSVFSTTCLRGIYFKYKSS